MAVHGSGSRMPWGEVPASLRAAVEDVLGSRVVSADSQSAGFSPGSADRVVTADGRRAFVKTASAAINARAVELHRQEAAIAAALPAHLPTPGVLGVIDRGDWIAVVFEDVAGRHPHTPWQRDEVIAVLDALDALTSRPAPPELATTLPRVPDAIGHDLRGFERLAADPGRLPALAPDDDAWVRTRLDRLAAMAIELLGEIGGDRLAHLDARADNLLVTPAGEVVLVDWPWAAVGAAWFDAFLLLVNVRLYDPAADVEALLAEHPVFAGLDPDTATRTIAGFTGFCLDAAGQPEVPAIPTLRRFQLDQGLAGLAWLRERMP
ncbi:hypothetical protein [Agromyces sp. SYSU T00194]|uniref:hypothetical protein n=1 Tax=Agromyces chitinivorans TaxID=3158560 RepID=UPI003393AD26